MKTIFIGCFISLLVLQCHVLNAQATDAPSEKQQDTVYGTFTVNGNKHEFKHAIAFEGLFFDDKVTMVWLTARPVDKDALKKALEGDFDAQQMYFMRQRGEQMTIRINGENDATVSGGADNFSLGGVQDLIVKCKVENQKVTASFKTDEVIDMGPFKYTVEGKFEVEMLK